MSLILKFEGDTRDLETKLKKALKNTGTQVKKLETQTAKSSKKMSSAFSSVGKVIGGLGIVIGGAALVKGIGSTISLASDLEESMNKVKEVFGAAASEIVSFSDTAATALGSSKQEALAMTGEIGNLLVSFGLTENKAAEFTKTIVQSAADIGSFNNALTKDVLVAYRAALVGSSEPMLRFGADTRATRLEQLALETGLIKTKRALTSQERAIAAVLAIQKDTAKAQGDFARTQDGLANSTKILKGQMLDLGASIGEGLIPFAKSAVETMRDFLGIFTDTEFDKALKKFKEFGGDAKIIKQLTLSNELNKSFSRRVKIAEDISEFQSDLERSMINTISASNTIRGDTKTTAKLLELQKTVWGDILKRQIDTAKQTKNQEGVEQTRNDLRLQGLKISDKLVQNTTKIDGLSKADVSQLKVQLDVKEQLIKQADDFLLLLISQEQIEKNITQLKLDQKGIGEAVINKKEEDEKLAQQRLKLFLARSELLKKQVADIVALKKSELDLGKQIAEQLKISRANIEGMKLDAAQQNWEAMRDATASARTSTQNMANSIFQSIASGESLLKIFKKIAIQALIIQGVKAIGNAFTGGTFGKIAGVFGFAHGGSFTVPGAGNTDKPFVLGLTPGERVNITPSNQSENNQTSQGGNTYHISFPSITRLDEFDIRTIIVPTINRLVQRREIRLEATNLRT